MDSPAVKRAKLVSDNSEETWTQWQLNIGILQTKLYCGCLCHSNTIQLQRPVVSSKSTVSKDYTIQFISTINLLCDTALKQQSTGFICSKVSEIASSVSNDESIWEILLECLDSSDKYISYATCKCLASFLLFTTLPHLDQIFEELFIQLTQRSSNPLKLSNVLEIVRTVIEYKDEDDHPLDLQSENTASQHAIAQQPCRKIEIDLETLESEVKNLCIKSLENWWTRLLSRFKNLISNYSPECECSITSFLELWQALISVKSNLSVIDTKHFYLNVESFVVLLTSSLPAIIWKKIIDIFNEILCYGSTLSLQDSPPEEVCNLAHLVIRSVKSRQFLQQLPYVKGAFTGFGGTTLAPVDWKWESEQTQGRGIPMRLQDVALASGSSPIENTNREAPSADQMAPVLAESKYDIRNVITSTIYIGPTPNVINMDDLSLDDSEGCNGDKPLLQKFVLLILKCVAVTVMETRDESDCSDAGSGASDDENDSRSASESETSDMIIIEKSIREVFQILDQFIKSLVPSFHPLMPLGEWIVKLFSDQDDALIEGMLCTLDTYTCFLGRIVIPKGLHETLNPVLTFITFTGTISEDKDTLLDLLMSNETCFLLYLLRFLKFIYKNWPDFVASCGCNLEKTMSLLIRLRLALHRLVEKSLFPYNINPLLRLLEKCEESYENCTAGIGSGSSASSASGSNRSVNALSANSSRNESIHGNSSST